MQSHDDVGMSFPSTPAELLSEMARLYKYDLSEFEAMLWAAQVFTVYPDDVVMRALIAHMESGTQDANFMPKYGSIKSKLEPVRGFKEIEAAVRYTGPYALPNITDPVLLAAIEQMGGWTRVCSELPDPVARPIDFDRYTKRFDTALLAARNQVQVQGQAPRGLKAIGSSSGAPALTNQTPLALAAPAPSGTKPQVSLELDTRSTRASIWSKPKP